VNPWPRPDFKKLDLREILLNSQELTSLITVIALSDKMRKMVSFEVIPHLCYSFNSKKTNTKKGDPNAGYHL